MPLALSIWWCLGATNFTAPIRAIDNITGESKVTASRRLCVICGLEVFVLLWRVLWVVHATSHWFGDCNIAVWSPMLVCVIFWWFGIIILGTDVYFLIFGVVQLQGFCVELLFHIHCAAETTGHGFGGGAHRIGIDATVLILNDFVLFGARIGYYRLLFLSCRCLCISLCWWYWTWLLRFDLASRCRTIF